MPHNIVDYTPEFKQMNRELKDFLFANLYRHWRVMRMSNKAKRFLRELFQAFVEDTSILPRQTQARLAPNRENLYRVVCDYLAGMTDRYALQEYERLFNPMAKI